MSVAIVRFNAGSVTRAPQVRIDTFSSGGASARRCRPRTLIP